MEKKPRPSFSQLFETVTAGCVYVGIGTIIATQVSAQSPLSATPLASSAPRSSAASTSLKTPIATKPDSADCMPNKAPDAMCTLPLRKGPEAKICFSLNHARCFELKEGHLIQSMNGSTSADSALNTAQTATVKSAIQTYQTWLEAELSKVQKSISLCRDSVSIDSKSEHKEYCLSKLAKKDVQSKTKDLFLTLENPTALKSK